MTHAKPMRDFGLEVFFSRWEFTAKHHMTASDLESMRLSDLLAMASPDDKAAFETLWLGYTETWGAPALRAEIAKTYERMQPENILCLAGAGEGLYTVAKVLLTADDHVIVPTPNYQSARDGSSIGVRSDGCADALSRATAGSKRHCQWWLATGSG